MFCQRKSKNFSTHQYHSVCPYLTSPTVGILGGEPGCCDHFVKRCAFARSSALKLTIVLTFLAAILSHRPTFNIQEHSVLLV